MDQHVNLLCRSASLELRWTGHIRRHLSVDATKKLVSSFVLSRRDYCSSLLASLPENRLDRLQRVQHNAARLVLGRRGRDHAKPLLRYLLWLPVRPQIEYRIPPRVILAEIHLVLPTYLVFSLSINFSLSAFCRRWSHDCSTHQTQQIWKACFLIHRTCDLEFPPQTSAWCPKSPLLQIQSENVSLQKASVLMTFTRVLSKAEFPVYLYILCSTCARMIVLTCCWMFTVWKKLQCLGCY